jgi:tRNA (guanine-N7-)-methyltransferase
MAAPQTANGDTMLDFLNQDKDPDSGRIMRRVRSFVLREGRLTKGQQQALEQLWPRYGLERRTGMIDPATLFGTPRPLVFEIGYGMGQSLADMATAAPDSGFIGVEVHRPGVGALLMAIEQQQLGNLRSYCDDAVDVLTHCIPDGSLARVQLYFPDPWHKKKHHKRRIVQPAFVELVRSKLQAGGVFHLATDWENYAEHMMEVMSAAPGWHNPSGDGQFAPRPAWRPETKFERRGARLGHGVWDLLFEKDR